MSGCSEPLRNDGHMFERLADDVSAIPIDDGSHPVERRADASQTQPGASPLKIDLVDQIRAPDSRALGLRAAATLVDSELAGLRRNLAPGPASNDAASPDSGAPHGFVAQLAAFPTRRAAESAWIRLRSAHAAAFAGLTPQFEAVDLGARGVWTRLQAGPLGSRDQAAAVCAQAGVADRWCVSPVRG